MAKRPIQLLPAKNARQLTEYAERARLSISRFAGNDTKYDAVGLQLLDEWIDRHLRQFPKPSEEILLIWGAFLGETFRRRFDGEWGIQMQGNRQLLGVWCPKDERGLVFIDTMDQLQRRIKQGMGESLAFYYTIKGIEIKGG